MDKKIYFISGHGDVTHEEFNKRYKPQINKAIKKGAKFIVGDFRGADTMAIDYLYWLGSYSGDLEYYIPAEDITVYHMFESPRCRVYNFKTAGGFKSDEDRDSEMTRVSHEDILWIREGREKSGTAKNKARRDKFNAIINFKNNQNG